MAKVAHLILVHYGSAQLIKLIERLRHPNASIFIHVDKKMSLSWFTRFLPPDIILIRNRQKINWGGYSMVHATLTAFKEILESNQDCDFINLLSGMDYPLVPASTVHKFLTTHRGKTFLEYEQAGSPWWNEAQSKFDSYHFVDYHIRGKYALQRVINHIAPKRHIPDHMEFVGRSQWLTIYSDHARYILKYIKNRPKIIRFFKYTWGSDEYFFHTLLFNSPFKNALTNDNLRYIDWSENNASPKILTSDDFNALIGSGKFYGRKFDIETDSAILNSLDRHIRSR